MVLALRGECSIALVALAGVGYRACAMQHYPLGRFSVLRIGFGAMQLPGPGVVGPPRDRDEALAVLRRAVELRGRPY